MTQHLGIDIDGLMPQVAHRDEEGGRKRHALVGELPPSLVLGKLVGEAPRLELSMPVDARGSGLDQTGEQPFDLKHRGAARLPIAYAWEMLTKVKEGDRPPTWKWALEAESVGTIAPGQAIAVGVRDLQHNFLTAVAHEKEPPKTSRTLVVPDSLSEFQQDHLLRALRLEAGQTRLLWRPVAAALAWIEQHGAGIGSSTPHHQSAGRLLHLHLGCESWEATVLDLVRHTDEQDKDWLLPGRRLPQEGATCTLEGWPARWLEQAAGSVLANGELPSDARRWNLLWATPWARVTVQHDSNNQRAKASLPPWAPQELAIKAKDRLAQTLWRTQTHHVDANAWPSVERRLGSRVNSQDTQAWLDDVRKSVAGPELLGAVVTGPFASLSLEGLAILGPALVSRIATIHTDKVLVEGSSPASSALLANGAAEFGKRTALAQPTYLDTLPSVHMIALVHGEPEWINLLETDKPWVMGSETWSKKPEKTRFGIQKGERDLTVSVYRGGSPSCRRVKTEFESPAASSSPVSLHVSITPGQGAPRVEVRPDDPSVLQGRSILLDWANAEDTGRSRDAELQAIDRVCPPHEPRAPSRKKWLDRSFYILREQSIRGVRGVIEAYLAQPEHAFERTDGGTEDPLKLLNRLLREWDARTNDGWATAVSSECTTDPSTNRDQESLRRFVTHLDDLLVSSSAPATKRIALRLLGVTSARTPHLARLLDRFLDRKSLPADIDTPGLWWCAGHCLVTPHEIHRLLQRASASFLGDHKTKALARALMFRRDALSSCPSLLTGELLRKAATTVRGLAKYGSFQIQFREAALLCTYLLRQRIYDPSFAAPGTPEFEELDSAFELARAQMSVHRVMGGVVDLEQLVSTVLDYIRRRGRGRLVALAIDDS